MFARILACACMSKNRARASSCAWVRGRVGACGCAGSGRPNTVFVRLLPAVPCLAPANVTIGQTRSHIYARAYTHTGHWQICAPPPTAASCSFVEFLLSWRLARERRGEGEGETDGGREGRDRNRDKDIARDRDRDRDRERQGETESGRNRDRETERQRDRETMTERQR